MVIILNQSENLFTLSVTLTLSRNTKSNQLQTKPLPMEWSTLLQQEHAGKEDRKCNGNLKYLAMSHFNPTSFSTWNVFNIRCEYLSTVIIISM